MTQPLPKGARSAWTQEKDAVTAAAALAEQLRGLEPKALFFFCAHQHDGAQLSSALKGRFPEAEVLGCSTAGEFTDHRFGIGGISALALDGEKVKRCAAVVAPCQRGVKAAAAEAVAQLSRRLGTPLRELDPQKHVGVVLLEGLKMREEEFNEELGNHAPLLSFVGGSAGDNLEFKKTQVYLNGAALDDGAVLAVLEMAVPFTVAKTCSFQSTGKVFKATRVDEKTRTLYELDGKPVADVYAQAVGVPTAKLHSDVFMSHPMGLMIDGKPWIRSPQQLLPDGGLRFYCRVKEGMEIHVMRSTDLVADTRQALEAVPRTLGKPAAGGLMFNCILRRLEMDAKGLQEPFYATMRSLQAAGFHTYGETYLGHINQTLTALMFA